MKVSAAAAEQEQLGRSLGQAGQAVAGKVQPGGGRARLHAADVGNDAVQRAALVAGRQDRRRGRGCGLYGKHGVSLGPGWLTKDE